MIILAILAFIVIGPIIFMGPLIPFRSAMKEEKSRLMRIVANKIDEEFSEIVDILQSGNIPEEQAKGISQLQELGDMIEKLPVWPFDANTLKNLLRHIWFQY